MTVSSYLELNWLAKADKYILLPPVIFADIKEGGFFHFPEKEEILIDDKYYPADRGLIVINNSNPEPESVIAHEWRHLWQFYNSFEYDGKGWDADDEISDRAYREKIVEYFTTSYHEYDALLFELKKAPNDTIKEWHEWIIKR